MRITPRAASCATIAAAMLWLAATAWMRPLMLPDEGRYVGVAWEMLQSGDWLTPTLNGLPFFHKPPLFYWVTAGSMALFGPHEWAARVASTLAATLGAAAIFLFLQRWSGQRVARLALVVLLVQPLYYIGGQFANLDMLVAGCIVATILLAAHASLLLERQLPHRKALAGAYAMAAAGVLAKGLIGAALPALVIVAWLLAMRRWRLLASLLWWPGLLLFLAIAAPWFVAMQALFPDFLDYFFVVQHFKRFASGGFNNVEPFWFYPVLLSLFFLPWAAWLWRSVRSAGTDDDTRSAVRMLMWAWLAIVVVFFSLPQSKLVGYILPAVPPVAALAADGFLRLREPSAGEWRIWRGAALVAAALSVGLAVALTLVPSNSSRDLALALRKNAAPGDAVFMVGKYRFDLPVYAGLTQPARVVQDWKAPDAALHDDQRKELADAGRFAPSLAARLLTDPVTFRAALCERRVSWVLGEAKVLARYPFLAAASVAHSEAGGVLWRVDVSMPGLARALDCPAALDSSRTAERTPPALPGRSRPRA